MVYFDMPLDELRQYTVESDASSDFDEFWEETLAESRRRGSSPVFTAVDHRLRSIEVFDVTFSGFDGQPIKAWLLLPRHRSGPLPAVVEYVGYGGGRGLPTQWLLWASAGYAHFVMDTRGQGSMWVTGGTSDEHDGGSGPQYPGFLTRGILDRDTYFYRRVFTDAVLAIDAVGKHPEVDGSRVVAAGGSQGGGIALAASALSDSVTASLIDVPFLCHFKRAIAVTDAQPYGELRSFLSIHRDKAEIVFRTLSYFDGVNLANRAKSPALFSVGLMDEICPPSTVFAAYNNYAGDKQIEAWPYNGHEAGAAQHVYRQFDFLDEIGVSNGLA